MFFLRKLKKLWLKVEFCVPTVCDYQAIMYVICLIMVYHHVAPKSVFLSFLLYCGETGTLCTTFSSSFVPVDCIETYRFCFVVKILSPRTAETPGRPGCFPGERSVNRRVSLSPEPWDAAYPPLSWAGTETEVKTGLTAPASEPRLRQ